MSLDTGSLGQVEGTVIQGQEKAQFTVCNPHLNPDVPGAKTISCRVWKFSEISPAHVVATRYQFFQVGDAKVLISEVKSVETKLDPQYVYG
jgi:hypothetical protein